MIDPILEQWMERDAADHKRMFDKLDAIEVRLDNMLEDVAKLKVKAAIWWGALSAMTTAVLYLVLS